ncbi:Ig-like domain-containing protein [Paenibacillus hexagrammi]|uniref:Ig-like domain-containing protein n=1 Tax=Paenibacillus hexagrammi TaxID=2908839 RepID=A0ABY3SJG1_9BACL|nr:Ig-like domain-containing protein [Paenibacillus sp. YPD9-1]UJF34192.1 Ig-like domain-containing protein [Paenibacillus sp. YPD9-1]
MERVALSAGIIGAMVFALPAVTAHAEGSRNLIANGGDRPYVEWDPNNTIAGIPRKNIWKVYAKAGETINLGSSVTGAKDNNDIVVRDPNGQEYSFDVKTSGEGFINTIDKEKAGPAPAAGGYTPYKITVADDQSGIWEVEFHSNASGATNPKASSATVLDASVEQGHAVAAWDITVKNGSEIKDGRVYNEYISMNMGSNSKSLNSDLYILTKDGYEYKTSLNGMDPYGFIFMSNNRGYIDKNDGSTLYHSTDAGTDNTLSSFIGNTAVQSPTYKDANGIYHLVGDTETDTTHRVFLNVPDPELSEAGIQTTPVTPETAKQVGFTGKETALGNKTFVGQGGTFTFDADDLTSYMIIVDTNGADGKPDGNFTLSDDLVIEDIAKQGTNTVLWDGKDQNGAVLPARPGNQPYQVQIRMKGGEYHFPMLDVESNPNGIKIKLISPANPSTYLNGMNVNTVFYNDANYKTQAGNVNLDAASGETAPNPRSAIGGVDSSNGAQKYSGSYGDFKGIDTWTYVPGAAVSTELYVIDGTISGKVFSDTNGDGNSTGDAGFAGISIHVKDSLGVEQDVVTDSNGTYTAHVAPGQVEISVKENDPALAGYKLTTSNAVQSKADVSGSYSFGAIGYQPNHAPTTGNDSKDTDRITKITGTVTGLDPDSDTLTYSLHSDAEYGSVTVNANGQWEYTPNASYLGSDQFTVDVTDGRGGTATSTVTVTITNRPPTAAGDSRTTPEDTAVDGAVTGNDVDGGTLLYKLDPANKPQHGTVDLKSDGSYTYTPNANYSGPDSFQVIVDDGDGGKVNAPVTITVTPVNDAPTAAGDNRTTPEDTAVDGAVTGSDVDGGTLSYTLDPANKPQHGTVDLKSDGSYTYTPNANYNGPDSFQVIVSDGQGGQANATVAITVTPENDAPTAAGDSRTTPEDTAVDGAVTGNDVDGGTLVYTLDPAHKPQHGTVDLKSDGSYTYTPNANYHGPDSFQVIVANGEDEPLVVTAEITVTPVNDVPTATGDSKVTLEDMKVNGKVTGQDADDEDVLQFTLDPDNSPQHGTVTVHADGSYTYTPNPDFNGPDSFDLIISDGHGGQAVAAVTITVTPVNDPPAVSGDKKTMPQNTSISGKVTGSDPDNDTLTFALGSLPQHGTATVLTDGSYMYTPNTNYFGEDSFEVTASDSHGGTATATVTITVTTDNQNPVVPNYTALTDNVTPVLGRIIAADPDGDDVIFNLLTNQGPYYGTVTTVTYSTYTDWTYTPNSSFTGIDHFIVEVTDGKGGTANSIVSITVTPPSGQSYPNHPPTAPNYEWSTLMNMPISHRVEGHDEDKDDLTYSVAGWPSHGTVTVTNSTYGDWTYTPAPGFVGTDFFTITVSDGNGGFASSVNKVEIAHKQLQLTLSADPQQILADGEKTSDLTALLTYQDGTPLSFVDVEFEAEDGTFNSSANPDKKKIRATTDGSGKAIVRLTSPAIETTVPVLKQVKAVVNDPANDLFAEGSITMYFMPSTINGIVINGETGLPVIGAIVDVSEDFDKDGVVDFAATVTTDTYGKYSIIVPRGNYVYTPVIHTTITKDGMTIPVDIKQQAVVEKFNGKSEDYYSDKIITGQLLAVDHTTNTVKKMNDFMDLYNQDETPAEGGSEAKVQLSAVVADDETGNVQIKIDKDGAFTITGAQKGKEYTVNFGVTLPDGQVLAGKTMNVKVNNEGEVSLQTSLIDPYGVVTDAATGNPIDGVKVTLYFKDTNTIVPLPVLPGFKPNDNVDPQMTKDGGSYAWMVFPNKDYYIIAEKSGYVTYDSRQDMTDRTIDDSYIRGGYIHVGNTIVEHSFSMVPIVPAAPSSGSSYVPSTPAPVPTENLPAITSPTAKITTVESPVSGKVTTVNMGETLTYKIETPAVNGKVDLKDDGSWIYTPNKDYQGTDSFIIVVKDELDHQLKTKVSIGVIAKPDKASVPTEPVKPDPSTESGSSEQPVTQGNDATVNGGTGEAQALPNSSKGDAEAKPGTGQAVRKLPVTGSAMDRSLLLVSGAFFSALGFFLRRKRKDERPDA